MSEIYQFIKSNNLLTNPDLTTQEELNQAYDALIQTGFEEMQGIVIDHFPTSGFKLTKDAFIKFFNTFIDSGILQSKNIFLTSDMQYQLLTCPKEILNLGYYHKSFNPNTKKFYFTYLIRGTVIEDETFKKVYFINTIEFDLTNSKFSLAGSIGKKEMLLFEKIFKSLQPDKIEDILFLADKVQNFSVHQFYLPYGLCEDKINNAVLMFRYDHTNAKHINYNTTSNSTMPLLYTPVYPPFVEFPHFHFPTTFGNVYKQNSRNEQHNFGVGYAIDAYQLKSYLETLMAQTNPDYLVTDYGMPFLYLLKNGDGKALSDIKKTITKLTEFTRTKNKAGELAAAVDFINGSTRVCTKSMLKTLSKLQDFSPEHSPNL